MITLKLGVYSENERRVLTQLLFNNRYELQRDRGVNCNGAKCPQDCEFRHLCTDLAQAHIYAQDYVVKR